MIKIFASFAVVSMMMFALLQFTSANKKIEKLEYFSSLTNPEICSENGGIYKQVCETGALVCVIEYSDGGKPCLSGIQCEGECRLNLNSKGIFGYGKCSQSSDPCGCWKNVEFGMAVVAVCQD